MDAQGEQLRKKCEEAQKLKEQGNKQFKQKQYIKALRCYHQANLYLSGLIDKQSSMSIYSKFVMDQQTSKRVKDAKFSVFMNMGQIYIYQSKFQKANEILSKAQQIKMNTKLKFRRAVVYMHLNDYQKSKDLFGQVLNEDSSLKEEVKEHLNKLKQLEKKSEEKSKKMYAKFFEQSH